MASLLVMIQLTVAALIASLSMSIATAIEVFKYEDLQVLRARDIKKILLSMGVDTTIVGRTIDKAELISLAMEAFNKVQTVKATHDWYMQVAMVLLCLALVTLIMVFRASIVNALIESCKYVWGELFLISTKMNLIQKSMKYGLLLATVALAIAIMIDIITPLINISTLLSWCVSSNSAIRRYFPPLLNIPLSANAIIGSGPKTGINIGPMVSLWILRLIKRKCEEFGASCLIKARNVRRKQEDAFYRQTPQYSAEDDHEHNE